MPVNRQFGQNLSRSFGNVGDFVANLILQNKTKEAKINQDTDKAIAEMMQANQERQAFENAFIDPSERNLMKLSSNQLSRYNAIQKIINPKVKPDQYINYQFDKPTVTAFNKTKGRFEEIGDNPYYSPPTYTDKGYNDKGQKIIKVFNKDSGELIREVPTGFYKKDQLKETTGEKFEPSDYAKSARYFTQQLSDLQNTQAKIQSDYYLSPEETQAAKSKVENESNAFANEVYLQLDDYSQSFIDEKTNEVSANNIPNNIAYQKIIGAIDKAFIDGVFNKAKNSDWYKKIKENNKDIIFETDVLPQIVQNLYTYFGLKYGTR